MTRDLRYLHSQIYTVLKFMGVSCVGNSLVGVLRKIKEDITSKLLFLKQCGFYYTESN